MNRTDTGIPHTGRHNPPGLISLHGTTPDLRPLRIHGVLHSP